MKGLTKEQADIIREKFPRLADVIDAIDKLTPKESMMFKAAILRSIEKTEDKAMNFLKAVPTDRIPSA